METVGESGLTSLEDPDAQNLARHEVTLMPPGWMTGARESFRLLRSRTCAKKPKMAARSRIGRHYSFWRDCPITRDDAAAFAPRTTCRRPRLLRLVNSQGCPIGSAGGVLDAQEQAGDRVRGVA
jgi:hypothetical protein